MSGDRSRPRPTDPDGLRSDGGDLHGVIDELDRYLDLTDADPSPGFGQRVMEAVEAEPAPRRSLLSWLTASSGGARRSLQAIAVAAVLLLAVAGAFAGGQLAGLLRGSATPAASSTTAPTVSPRPTSTPSLIPSPSPSVEPSVEESATSGPGGSAEASDGGSLASGSSSASPSASGEEDHSGDRGSSSPSPGATASGDH